MEKIISCLWFDKEAEEAAKFYTNIFKNSQVLKVNYFNGVGEEFHGKKAGEPMLVHFELEGIGFAALNGGPYFTPTPSHSQFVTCTTTEEVDRLWDALSQGGKTLMELGSYSWSERYGWLQDKYGYSWQIGKSDEESDIQKITPTLLFQNKKCRDALNFYSEIFSSQATNLYEEDGMIFFGQIKLLDQVFTVMDSPTPHDHTFNEATSFVINCEDQKEIDYYWNKLSDGGDPSAQQCGWLKDKFGISWQIVPKVMEEIMDDYMSEKSLKSTKAMYGMKKLEIDKLLS